MNIHALGGMLLGDSQVSFGLLIVRAIGPLPAFESGVASITIDPLGAKWSEVSCSDQTTTISVATSVLLTETVGVNLAAVISSLTKTPIVIGYESQSITVGSTLNAETKKSGNDG